MIVIVVLLITTILITLMSVNIPIHSREGLSNARPDLTTTTSTDLRNVKEYNQKQSHSHKYGIALLMRKPEDLPLWLKHHRELGISKFYIRMEDTPGWEEFLKAQPDIEYEIAESDATNNYETLQKRQIAFVNQSLRKAEKDGIEWLFHIDADELLEGNLALLNTISPEIKTITMTNVEAVYDGTEKTCFDARRFKRCQEKGANCRSYANGKSAGRVIRPTNQGGMVTDTPKTTLKGPHNFAYAGDHIKYNKQIDFNELHVLHFDSCSFGAWAEKFRHLNKGTTNKDKTPFPYYEESKKIASSAYTTYMKTVSSEDNDTDDIIYVRK